MSELTNRRPAASVPHSAGAASNDGSRVLEAELQENRQLNRRVAELTDLVADLLVPLARHDDADVDAIVEPLPARSSDQPVGHLDLPVVVVPRRGLEDRVGHTVGVKARLRSRVPRTVSDTALMPSRAGSRRRSDQVAQAGLLYAETGRLVPRLVRGHAAGGVDPATGTHERLRAPAARVSSGATPRRTSAASSSGVKLQRVLLPVKALGLKCRTSMCPVYSPNRSTAAVSASASVMSTGSSRRHPEGLDLGGQLGEHALVEADQGHVVPLRA